MSYRESNFNEARKPEKNIPIQDIDSFLDKKINVFDTIILKGDVVKEIRRRLGKTEGIKDASEEKTVEKKEEKPVLMTDEIPEIQPIDPEKLKIMDEILKKNEEKNYISKNLDDLINERKKILDTTIQPGGKISDLDRMDEILTPVNEKIKEAKSQISDEDREEIKRLNQEINDLQKKL